MLFSLFVLGFVDKIQNIAQQKGTEERKTSVDNFFSLKYSASLLCFVKNNSVLLIKL